MTTADRMAVLDRASLQQVGSAAELYDYPQNRFVAGFVGTANLLDGEVTAVDAAGLNFQAHRLGALRLPPPAEPLASGRPPWPCGRTRSASPRRGTPPTRRAWLDGQVESAEFWARFSRYRVRGRAGPALSDHPHFAGVPLFAPARRCGWASIRASCAC